MTEYKDQGLTGLANLGNTCFMNTTLQCLSHTYSFNDFLKEGAYKQKIQKKPAALVLMEWDKLRVMMWSENCIISPGGFLTSVQKVAKINGKHLFTGFAQNDLPEFLTFIIDCFHTAIMREVNMKIKGKISTKKDKVAKRCYEMMKNMYKNEYSEILDIFYGIHVSCVKDAEGNTLSCNPEPFLMLDLPIPDKTGVSLIDCFDEYTKKELLDEDNQYINDEGKKVVAKQIEFWKFPEVLIITLKRFTNSVRKNNCLVDFPLNNLDLSKYVVGYDPKSFKYELYGICNHVGSITGGHYYANVKNANNKWYEFNDATVKEISESTVKTPATYCLFYRKKK
jgi:ubiquitin carboxyl-terminal hydrolase 8